MGRFKNQFDVQYINVDEVLVVTWWHLACDFGHIYFLDLKLNSLANISCSFADIILCSGKNDLIIFTIVYWHDYIKVTDCDEIFLVSVTVWWNHFKKKKMNET